MVISTAILFLSSMPILGQKKEKYLEESLVIHQQSVKILVILLDRSYANNNTFTVNVLPLTTICITMDNNYPLRIPRFHQPFLC